MISAVIFDLDGTILSNEDEYGKAFKKVLGSLGKKVSSDYPQVGGVGVKENWPLLLAKYKIKTDKSFDELATYTQEEYLKSLDEVTLKPGFETFINELKKEGIKTALATSNVWRVLEKVFDKFPVQNYFDATTTAEEVVLKKPSPDLFLVTSDKLGEPPENCLVIEDSEAGIEAAREAGMKAVGIARDKKHAQTLSQANLVVFSYSELSLEVINNL